jgi:hypothetical protein
MKPYCPHGHAMTKANTYLHSTRGYAQCRECRRIRGRAMAKQVASRHGHYSPSRALGGNVKARVAGLMRLLAQDYADAG